MKWESPRGPISIDPETRDIVQTVYVRKVEKVGGKLVNVEIAKIPNVKDPEHGDEEISCPVDSGTPPASGGRGPKIQG